MSKIHQPIDDAMYHYLVQISVREAQDLAALRELTDREVEFHQMMSPPEQTQFLVLLIELIGAKRVIEIGVFTGYSTLAMAKALPQEGEIIACDIGPDWPSIGKSFWEKAGVDQKIKLFIDRAENTLQKLLDDQQQQTFDFIYVDADKIHYDEYYELGLKLLRPGGLLIFDNVLWIGESRVYSEDRPATKSVHALNHKLHQDSRVSISLVPFGQGMMLARKRV